MSAQVTVIAGPARCGKTDRVLLRYRTVLAENSPGAAVWLAPNWRAAAELQGRLLGGACDGCFSPAVMTFENFADAVLEVAPVAIRPMSRLMKRQLVRQLIEDQQAEGRLKHFRRIAGSSGLVDLVCRWISELKRLEIWPERFRDACHARGITVKDVELLEIYDRYQRLLGEHQLYDAEGRFWSARRLLKEGQRRPWERLRLLVADGFTDFTRTQHEILEILAGRAEELLITLPLEHPPLRKELFAKPLRTLSELRRRHARLVVEQMSRPERPDWPAMAHIEKALFGNPRQAKPAHETAGVEILAAARQSGEIELIGARIKQLIARCEARPGKIAVVLRWPEDAGSLVGEVFDTLGIPFSLEIGQSLGQQPALKALVGLLRLDVEDWPFGQLLAVLRGNYFRPDWPQWREGQTAVAAERAIRRLQIPRGRRRLLKQLEAAGSEIVGGETVGGDSVGDGAPGRSVADRVASYNADDVRAVLRRLAAALDELPERATLADWGKAWQRLAQQTGLLRAMERDPQGGARLGLPDSLAWTRLIDAGDAGDRLARRIGRHPAELDRRGALAALLDLLCGERIGPGGDESGRVRILSATSARGLRIPYLFVAGLSEKAFPAPDREDRLYSEAECQRLIEEGLPLPARTERSREEMLLFYEVLSRATRRLYLSYPALDESAQPLSPSPYLKEVEQACGRGQIPRIERTDPSPVPAGDEPLSVLEFRVKALSTATEGNVSLLAGLVREEPELAENILAGLQLTHLRGDRERFGPADGMLFGDAVRQHLCTRFDPRQTFSATALEQYAGCPYRFFLQRVLKLEPVEELALAVDYMERGRLAHAVLAAFHRRVSEVLGRPGSPTELQPQQYDRLMSETLEQLPGESTQAGIQAAMREVDRRLLVQWTADYRRQHECYDKLWQSWDVPLVPEFFEVSFGQAAGGEAPPSTGRPLELRAEDQTVRISGRIDRIDTGRVAGQAVFNVIDYKTGASVKFSHESVAAGRTLQLPLYALAVAELLLGDSHPVPWQAGYWYVRDDGFRPQQALKMHRHDNGRLMPETDWEEIRSGLAATVVALVQGIRQGQFPVYNADEHCTRNCPYRTVCRINQVRSLEKTWQPGTNED